MASFTINKENGCWEWNKTHPTAGYGGISCDGKQVAAHRASWIFYNGVIGENICVLHKCDNRACVNPKHLYLGDKKQNRKDFMERHPMAKELVATGQKAATEGLRKFWTSLSVEERKEFTKKRWQIQNENFGHPMKGIKRKWITNGERSMLIKIDCEIPNGWRKGRIL